MDIKHFNFNQLEGRFLSMFTGTEDELMTGIYNKSPVILDWHNKQRKKWLELICAYEFNCDFVFVKIKPTKSKSFSRVYYNFRYKKYIIEFEAPRENESIYDASIKFAQIVDTILTIYDISINSEKYGDIHISLLALKFGIDIFPDFNYLGFIDKEDLPGKETLSKFFHNEYFVDEFKLMSIEDVLDLSQYWLYDVYEEEDKDGDKDSVGDNSSE